MREVYKKELKYGLIGVIIVVMLMYVNIVFNKKKLIFRRGEDLWIVVYNISFVELEV